MPNPTFPIPLPAHLCRFSAFYPKHAPAVPKELAAAKAGPAEAEAVALALRDFPLPLPSKKKDYTCQAPGQDGAVWYGAKTGLTYYDPGAARLEDRVRYFSAQRDLPDNEVLALLPAEAPAENVREAVWVLTKTGATHITLRWTTPQEQAELLLAETLEVVDRRGMVSQRHLSVPYRPETKVPYNESDNDGCFTAGFAIGEMLHYAVFRRELGEDHPETQRARKTATRAAEACLLLMYMPGRGNGFVARTYMTPHEPIPAGGLYFRKQGDQAICVTTHNTLRDGIAGTIIDASAPVPERLAHLYKDEGFTGDGLVYKADTSSDEITLHFAHLWFLHTILGPADPELDQLARDAAKALMRHIIEHGYEMHDFGGEPTTWSKWSERYFSFGSLGWYDSCLNAAEVLMYLRVTMAITGESDPWQAAFDELIGKGYAELPALHHDRLVQGTMAMDIDPIEEIMFGDHMLATMAFWPLITLEPDEALKEKFRAGFRAWRGTIAREYNPGYDLPFHLACPDDAIDWERLTAWFGRSPASRLGASVTTARQDIPLRARWGGSRETAALLADDERFVAKYDRNPYEFRDEEGGTTLMESGYVYTFAYWIGRYYGIFEDQAD
ncbi:MAG: hypothetical protein LBJ11_11710 [Oscillospiraceae bacterium]|jgi:hypothetical protein|nr:hypothetical protein [Oscillospiraceae bacterium]